MIDLRTYVELCGAMSPLGKLVLASDLSIAAAYFAIPVGLLIVWRKRLQDLPYPWMFVLFAAFIVACGMTHLVHAYLMPFTTFEHTPAEALVKVICAALSVVTAGALIAVMPRALKLISPRERSAQLERQVAQRTQENTELLRELNHRLGNQLQVMMSLVRVEKRRATEASELQALDRVQTVLDDLVRAYHIEEARYRGLPSGSLAAIDHLRHDLAPLETPAK